MCVYNLLQRKYCLDFRRRILFYIIFVLILFLLIVSIMFQKKKYEKWLWLKVIVIYLSFFVSLTIGVIKVPILIIIAYFIIKEKSKLNRRVKFTAGIFSLMLFISVRYVIPLVPLKEVYDLKKQVALENRFQKIDAIYRYSEDSEIQSKLKRYNPKDNVQTKFSVWVYDSKNITIKDYEWLCADSYGELDLYWNFNDEKDYSEVYMRFNKTGEEFIGIFKRNKDGMQYLQIVIEGKMKSDERPKSIFDMF